MEDIITDVEQRDDGSLYFVCDVADGRYMECVIEYDNRINKLILRVNDYIEAKF